MPISYSNRFIFFHIPRCAGTSIEYYFDIHHGNPLFGFKYIGNKVYTLQHLTYSELHNSRFVTPETIDKFFKFTIIRDPLDRAISDFHWQKAHDDNDIFSDFSFSQYLDYAEKVIAENLFHSNVHLDHFRPASNYCFLGGEWVLDRVFALEHLMQDHSALSELIGLEEFPKMNVSAHNSIFQPTAQEVDRVYELYAEDKALHDQVMASSQVEYHEPDSKLINLSSITNQTEVSSSAILCLVRNELPYLLEWIEYHLGMGISTIYLICTDDQFIKTFQFVQQSPFAEQIRLFRYSKFEPGWQLAAYDQFVNKIEEDWVLVLDIDEYLYLHDNSDLTKYLQKVSDDIGQIQFPWVNLISSEYFFHSITDVLSSSSMHISNHVKSIARTESLTNVGIHSHGLSEKLTMLSSGQVISPSSIHNSILQQVEYFNHHPFILHFTTRGHLDTLCRIADQKFFNDKCGPDEFRKIRSIIENETDLDAIPNRYWLIKVQECLQEIELDIKFKAPLTQTNIPELSKACKRILSIDLESALSQDTEIHQNLEDQLGINGKLNRLQIADHFDLDEYASSNTQMDYVTRIKGILRSLPDN